jgi:predicted Zn-dependent protease
VLWRLRPRTTQETSPARGTILTEDPPSNESPLSDLRGLIRRFPYWMKGRELLADSSLAVDDVATAYAESQALLTLAPHRSPYHTAALLHLGQCFLRRGDPSSALGFLDQAHTTCPGNTRIQEERSAALVLLGERVRALQILKDIPTSDLSAEGRAALQWLSRDESTSHS